MKKLIYCAAALVTALIAGSCQRELLDPAQDGSTVTFTVNVPEVATKSIGDAQNVNNLVYAVYRVTGETEADAKKGLTPEKLVYQDHNSVVEGKSTVTLELINDQAYVVVFWAQVANTWFDNDYQFGTKTVTYPTGLVANDDKYSAFYGVSYINDVKGPNTKNITLHRPFAQINIATKDPEKYNVAINKTSVSVANAAYGFDVAKEEPIVKENYSVSFEAAPMPKNEKLTVNGIEYQTRVQNTGSKENDVHHYIAMNYVFADGNVDVTYVIDTDHGVVTNTISNVPVAKNHRTNIVGNLLTSDVKYNVELDQDWGPEGEVDNDNVVSVWDGTSMSEPTYDATSNTYTIYKAEELAWVAAAVNGTLPETRSAESISFDKQTVVLAADINLNGKEWTPIGLKSNNYAFKGSFDGANHTVSNFYVNNEGYAGLFGHVYVGTVNNLTVKDVTIVSNHYAGAIVGQGYVNMENCHVENVNITLSTKNGDWGDKAGGIIGQNCEGAKYIKNSSAKNVTITGYRDLGGIAGMAHNNNIVSGCSVENITITQDLSVNYETTTPTTVGAVVGRVGSNATIENNEVVGGIVIEKLVNSQKAFEELVQTDGTIVLNNGEYNIPSQVGNAQEGTITVIGNGVDTQLKGAVNDNENHPGNYAHEKHIVLKDLTYITPNKGYNGGFGHAKSVTFINCTIIGQMYAHSSAPHYFYECTIDPLTGYLYTYSSDCVFEGCTFNASEGKALQIYSDGADGVHSVTIKDCAFSATKWAQTWDGKPVTGIDINSNGAIFNVTVENCTTTGFPTGLNSGSDLYNIKDGGLGKVTLTIDGVCVVRAGYSKLANYPNIWVKDNNYYVFDKAGLAELNTYFKANWCSNDVWNHEYHIGADIDAEGLTWNSAWINVGWNGLDGLVFDGNNHTISNLKINGSLFGGTPNGGDAGTAPGYVKDITIDNATVTGDHWTAVFWGDSYGEIVYDNVTVKNTSVTGNCNTAIFLAGTVIEGAGSIDNILFKNCKVENCSVVANGKDGQDPTGASGFVGRTYGKTSLKFEGTNTIDEATTITNNNGLVGGRVYAYTVHIDGNWEGTGVCDTFTNWDGVSIAAKVGTTTYNTIEQAIEAATAGDTVKLLDDVESSLTLPAGITFNGNGKQINGSIIVVANVTFAGHTKATKLETGSNLVLTVDEGACLEVTGGDRSTLGYNNEFKFIGTLEDAKSADKTKIQPSLILPGGLSVTGGNDAVMSFTNAYVKIGNTSSKNSVANGTFTLNIENSIAEFTNQLTFAEPTSGKNPTFKLNVKNSVLTTATKFCIAAPNTNVVIDNSTVTLGSYLRNSGQLTLKNGSTLTGATIQFGESGGNNGVISVNNSNLSISCGNSTGHAFDGQGYGEIILYNNAIASVQYYKAMTITKDETSTFTGTQVQ